MSGEAKPEAATQRPDSFCLGIAVLQLAVAEGRITDSRARTLRVIGAFCGYSRSTIFNLEQQALQKLRRRMRNFSPE